MKKYVNLRPIIAEWLIFAFLVNTFGPLPLAQAQEFSLPAPGVMVPLSPEFNPPILKGIKVHPNNPFRFDFILDQGDETGGQLKAESTRLIKYFLASLTIPENDLWVNLSPYEKNRIIPQSFGLTEMGRDLLAEDYMLKQITASLIYPEDKIGKKFWQRIYEEAAKKFGTTNIPVNTFNKVWIVPDKAVVYENPKACTAYIVESKLKVMLEQDYLSLSHHVNKNDINAIGSQIVREIVIPEITKEVNEGKNFAQLRQVYNSLILAIWYKKKIKDSILEQVYADKKKVTGVEYKSSVIARNEVTKQSFSNDIEAIYQQYLQAFKKGVFNYIKEEPTDVSLREAQFSADEADEAISKGTTIPRKYFSGGAFFGQTFVQATGSETSITSNGNIYREEVSFDPANPRSTAKKKSSAMTSDKIKTRDIFHGILQTKWGMRQLLRGGKIRQPDWFVIFKRNLEGYSYPPGYDFSYSQRLTDLRDVHDFREIAKKIISGQIPLPIVFKPNRSADARGIFFISEGEGTNLVITTLAYAGKTNRHSQYAKPIFKYFQGLGISPKIDIKQNIMQFNVDTSQEDAAVDILYGLWKVDSFNLSTYDAGGMESVIKAFALDGRSYESRFIFAGNLATGDFRPTPNDVYDGGFPRQMTRVGDSGFISNSQNILTGKAMYQDVLQAYGINPKRWQEFEDHIYGLINDDFKLMVSRLHAAGMNVNEDVKGEFDLKWLAPDPEKGEEFPQPFLIESNVRPLSLDRWDQYILSQAMLSKLKIVMVLGLALTLGQTIPLWAAAQAQNNQTSPAKQDKQKRKVVPSIKFANGLDIKKYDILTYERQSAHLTNFKAQVKVVLIEKISENEYDITLEIISGEYKGKKLYLRANPPEWPDELTDKAMTTVDVILFDDLALNPLGKRSPQTQAYSKAKWGFVLKRFFESSTRAAYALAQRSLGGLVADFIFVDLEHTNGPVEREAIIMKKISTHLDWQIRLLLKEGNIKELEELLKTNTHVILQMVCRGVLPLEASVVNFGIDKGRQVVIDPGKFTDLSNIENILALRNVFLDNRDFIRRYRHSYPQQVNELLQFYTAYLRENGLDERSFVRTIQGLWNTQAKIPVNDIWLGIKASFNGMVRFSEKRAAAASPNEAMVSTNKNVWEFKQSLLKYVREYEKEHGKLKGNKRAPLPEKWVGKTQAYIAGLVGTSQPRLSQLFKEARVEPPRTRAWGVVNDMADDIKRGAYGPDTGSLDFKRKIAERTGISLTTVFRAVRLARTGKLLETPGLTLPAEDKVFLKKIDGMRVRRKGGSYQFRYSEDWVHTRRLGSREYPKDSFDIVMVNKNGKIVRKVGSLTISPQHRGFYINPNGKADIVLEEFVLQSNHQGKGIITKFLAALPGGTLKGYTFVNIRTHLYMIDQVLAQKESLKEVFKSDEISKLRRLRQQFAQRPDKYVLSLDAALYKYHVRTRYLRFRFKKLNAMFKESFGQLLEQGGFKDYKIIFEGKEHLMNFIADKKQEILQPIQINKLMRPFWAKDDKEFSLTDIVDTDVLLHGRFPPEFQFEGNGYSPGRVPMGIFTGRGDDEILIRWDGEDRVIFVRVRDKQEIRFGEWHKTNKKDAKGKFIWEMDSAQLGHENVYHKQNEGGIDLTPANMNVQVKTGSPTKAFEDDYGGIKLHLNPAMLAQLQNAPGFVPVVINFQPLPAGQAGMRDLKKFLEVPN